MKSICRVCSANRRSELILLLCGVATACLGGCASVGAKPWEHDLLAERAMRVDPYPLQSAMDDHIYFSKEASTGGRSYAGGGCGCN
jgi:Domain of unknown function (DUF4266)